MIGAGATKCCSQIISWRRWVAGGGRTGTAVAVKVVAGLQVLLACCAWGLSNLGSVGDECSHTRIQIFRSAGNQRASIKPECQIRLATVVEAGGHREQCSAPATSSPPQSRSNWPQGNSVDGNAAQPLEHAACFQVRGKGWRPVRLLASGLQASIVGCCCNGSQDTPVQDPFAGLLAFMVQEVISKAGHAAAPSSTAVPLRLLKHASLRPQLVRVLL
mmetsp:Transcript_15267/g.41301  ORF Transcript_15267/g.41301 Transcript_15267/m.41301 type:complete len:217 (+) Transcript_15267:518-1168(+)